MTLANAQRVMKCNMLTRKVLWLRISNQTRPQGFHWTIRVECINIIWALNLIKLLYIEFKIKAFV